MLIPARSLMSLAHKVKSSPVRITENGTGDGPLLALGDYLGRIVECLLNWESQTWGE